MSVVGESLHLCPFCGSDEIEESSGKKPEITCGQCGGVLQIVPDGRGATLKLVVKKSGQEGIDVGRIMVTLTDLDIVRPFAEKAAQG